LGITSFRWAVYITKADESLKALGYTEHSFAHVTKVSTVAAEILSKLGLKVGEISSDGKWIVTSCRCLGCCGLAPAITINGEVYGKVKVEDVEKILNSFAD
jgi:NADH:ubiquinone oxidoreductase subunit E